MASRSLPSPLPAVLAALTLGLTMTSSARPAAAPTYDWALAGNPADVSPAVSGGLLLMGGGTDVDAAFRWLIGRAGGGDIVVLRATGTDAYDPYILGLGAVDSVETLVLKNRKATIEPFVLDRIHRAEALFIAGGDQADYVAIIKGTPVEDALQAAMQRGVPIGGTSAGLAVLGEFVFAATRGSVTSSEALADPYDKRMTLDRDFLTLPGLAATITDSHFVERDRLGRLVAFLARLAQDGWAATPRGLAVNSETAVLVDDRGRATVVANAGNAAPFAYFASAPGIPQVAAPKTPLTYLDVGLYRIGPGGAFDLGRWSGSGGTAYSVSATAGVLSSTQPGGALY